MKSAGEWAHCRDTMNIDVTWHDDPGRVVKEFADFLKIVQLDAWKQGMTDAAMLIVAHPELRGKILAAIDSKTTL